MADELKRTEPKSFEVGDTETLGIVPSPVRATLYVPVSGSSEAMARFAVLLPPDVGVKVTFCVQFNPAAKGSSASCGSLGELIGIGSGDVD